MYEVVFADRRDNVLASYEKKKLVAAASDARSRAQRASRSAAVMWRERNGRQTLRALYGPDGAALPLRGEGE